MEAAIDLRRACTAAGLRLSPWTNTERKPCVDVGTTDPATALHLARLIRKSLKRAFKTADVLSSAFQAHGLDVPTPHVYGAKIRLGNVSICTADRLACVLGAPSQPELAETPDWPEGQQVLDRLDAAFKQATRGGFMDTYFHPYCQRCGGEPAITLGDLTLRTARRLVTALQYGA
ncbi:hypothetical protein [Streptantibioticus ferralitis]|uniref:Uncharacterized protein n=1 Tax=Streptantibioticus ferralitis TaxID=236510 RepID=A0ABT5Z027_9ACTN|nr:hypothetical protein [Streptantibioticus ferralitis]MDF2257197.1 hypothetical protein [Streptantibioticus ferralitis]